MTTRAVRSGAIRSASDGTCTSTMLVSPRYLGPWPPRPRTSAAASDAESIRRVGPTVKPWIV